MASLVTWWRWSGQHRLAAVLWSLVTDGAVVVVTDGGTALAATTPQG